MLVYFKCVLLLLSVNALEIFPDRRIVGGKDADILEFPYQVSVKRLNAHICGGAIITEFFILTAAHCVYKQSALTYSIRAGSTFSNQNGVLVNVAALYAHPKYNETNMDNDIAILKLKNPLQFNSTILPVALPKDGEEVLEGTSALVSGWGYTKEEGSVSTRLQVVQLPIISKKKCQNAYALETITDKMICAGLLNIGGQDACQGDSGGPLRASGKLVGIVSWGYGCARPQYPGVYTKVASFRSWIKSVTNY